MEEGGTRESGFINSTPCIAEFMSDLGPINERYGGPSITGAVTGSPSPTLPAFCQQLLNGSADPLAYTPGLDMTGMGLTQPPAPGNGGHLPPGSKPRTVDYGPRGPADVKLPEYPWMKEKKSSKRGCHTTSPQSGTPGPPQGHLTGRQLPPGLQTALEGYGEYRTPQSSYLHFCLPVCLMFCSLILYLGCTLQFPLLSPYCTLSLRQSS